MRHERAPNQKCDAWPQHHLGPERGPVVLHDDSVADDLARVVADVGLMKRMLDVGSGGGEVSEVHHGHEVEVALEIAGVIAHVNARSSGMPRSESSASRYPCFASAETPSAHRMEIT